MRQDASSTADCQQQQQPLSSGQRSSCAPVPSGSASPKLRRRTASGSSAGSEVRQSLELDVTMASQARPLSNATSRIPVLQAEVGRNSGDEDGSHPEDAKSSSGPIGAASNGSPVRRTRSLKEQLIHKFSSVSQKRNAAAASGTQPPSLKPPLKDVEATCASPPVGSPKAQDGDAGLSSDEFVYDHHAKQVSSRGHRRGAASPEVVNPAVSSRSSSPKKVQQDSSQEDLAQPRQSGASTPTKQLTVAKSSAGKPPQQLNRNRAGSLRGNSVVKVLPDRQLLSKASSSENISQQSDLTTLTSLVQRKRDRSQDSLDQGGKAASAFRKPPTPTSLDSDDGSDTAKTKPPIGKTTRKTDSPTGRSTSAGVDDSALDATDTDRESPCEDQQSDGEVTVGGSGQNRSNSLEILLQSSQQPRTAPQIRQPSARPVRIESANRDASPCKMPSSSPPKAVSFNPFDEVTTFEEESREHRRPLKRDGGTHRLKREHSHRDRKQEKLRNGDVRISEASGSKIGDNALIEVHSTLVGAMEGTINRQRHFLNQVREGKTSISDYRDIMKMLLQMQTKTIQQIVDTIQSNEKGA